MNLRGLEYLLALDRYESFNRAAVHCNVSQPALSIQVKKLEEELGVTLLERSKKEFLFTECGREVLERAEDILGLVNEIEELAESWSDPYGGTLSIGAFPTLAPYYFPQITQHLIETYPKLSFNLIEDKTDALIERLKKGDLDVAFLAAPVYESSFESAAIFKEEFKIGISPNHKLGSQSIITESEIDAEELLLLEDGHCLQDQSLDYCSTAGLNNVLNFRASSMATLLEMIKMERGISFIPECVQESRSDINYLTIHPKAPGRQIGLYWRKSSPRTELMLEIADDLQRLTENR